MRNARLSSRPPSPTTKPSTPHHGQVPRQLHARQHQHPGAVQVGDIHLAAWPECAEVPEIVNIDDVLEVTPSVLDFGAVEVD